MLPSIAPIILKNMPQFLQRNIKKYSTGLVMLYDTTKIIIIPNCILNQTWLFDSIYNKTAICTFVNTQNIFGVINSVKTILINNIDTLKLRKSFGIIVFPQLYNVNKYYRMVGIENKNSYDLNALFENKVPDAWDFYNFNIGDEFCNIYNYRYASLSNSNCRASK